MLDKPRGAPAKLAIGLLLAAGFCAAQASAAAYDDLPKEVVGVVGSGDQLSLEVKAAGSSAPRTVRVGAEYKDGWTLQALTSTQATLVKAGESREVGLNPSGAVATGPDDAAPSTVVVSDPQVSAIVNSENAAAACRADYARRGGVPEHPFNSEAEGEAWRAAGIAKFGQPMMDLCFEGGMQRVLMMQALTPDQRRTYYTLKGDTNAVRALDRLPPIGPDKISGPDNIGLDEIARQAGLKSAAGYSTGLPPEPQNVMYKCWTPQTPASVAYKCEM